MTLQIKSVRRVKAVKPEEALVFKTGTGYIQGAGAALPDIDTDYQGDRRQDVKAYLERRYNINGQTRVYSAGTFTTLKIKAAIKDIAKIHRVPFAITNYITAIIDDAEMSFTDFFKLAYKNKKIKKFVDDYPEVIEDIRTILKQPKASSIHASAVIVTPATKDGKAVDCFDYTPIRQVDGLLVSEFDGYDLDEMGYLKTDVLNTVELTKQHRMFDLIKEHYDEHVSLTKIEREFLEDRKTFELLSQGHTINIFQFSSDGMTKLMKDLQPDNIEDLVALNALYRPATIALGSPDAYIRAKHGEIDPIYPWGTQEILGNTFAQLTYQEQMSAISQVIGNFSKSESVTLIKHISKKKVDKIMAMKEKFMAGAEANGCPEDDAKLMWHMFEVAGTYSFNRSHAVCYALTAYAGAWVKANYPAVFYTVALQFEKDEDDVKAIMLEMERASDCKIVPPDINKSEEDFLTNYETSEIFWSLLKIKFIGVEAVRMILEEREAGAFENLHDFVTRMEIAIERRRDAAKLSGERFTNPVNTRVIRHLIYAGCFDKVENVSSPGARRFLIEGLEWKIPDLRNEKDISTDNWTKEHLWSKLQIDVSSLGVIDYNQIYERSGLGNLFKNVSTMSIAATQYTSSENAKIIMCATIAEAQEIGYNDKSTGERKVFGKILLQQNNDIVELCCWDNSWGNLKDTILENVGKVVVLPCYVKYNPRNGMNQITCSGKAVAYIIN